MRRHSVAGRAAPLILALGLLLAGGSATHPQLAQANPVLPSAYLIHVHPPEANDCMVGTVTTCEEVIETSSATGTLQFDLYLFSNYGLDQYWVDGLLTLVAWSAGWEVLLWEVCHDGVGSVDIDGNVAEVNLHWPGGAWTHDEVFLAAQFLVQVPAHGFFGQLESYAGVASLHTQNGSLILHPAQHAAEAGMSCGTCSTPCPLHGYCRPFLEPTVIDLEVVTGETTETSATSICTAPISPVAMWSTGPMRSG